MNIRLISNSTSLDLSSSESIKIIDKIQDNRDISKIVSPYSQQFNLPATAKNNIFFKQYYNFDVVNSFDARIKVDATITIAGYTFKRGKLRLNSVSLKNGEPISYKVVFFGDAIEIKDLLKDDLISGLNLNEYDHEFTDSKVREGIEEGLEEGGITTTNPKLIYPFISHTRRFIYSGTEGVIAEGETGVDGALSKEDLKPAIQCKVLIDKIAEKYGFTFSSTFLNSERFKGLFLWLHRKEGGVLVDSDENEVGTIVNNYSDLTVTSGDTFDIDTTGGVEIYDFNWTITYMGTSSYRAYVMDRGTGDILANYELAEGGNSLLSFSIDRTPEKLWDLDFVIEANDLISISQSLGVEKFLYEFDGYYYGTLQSDAFSTLSFPTNDVTNRIRISRLLPKLKVFDFLQILFKLFNLTAYKNSEGEIVLETLPDFFENHNTYDITEYVDLDTKEVSRLFPYRAIEFKFKGDKTFLNAKRNQITGQSFGNLFYDGGNPNFDGGVYTVEAKAEKMLYERLRNTGSGANTGILYGWAVDEKEEPLLTEPLLFYKRLRTVGLNTFPFKIGTGTVGLTNYYAPSNTFKSDFAVVDNYTLNFGVELDEFSLVQNDATLFETNYKDYVSTIYNRQSRKVTLTAYLPLHIILSYTLKDVFIVNGKKYRINEITTDLITGKSELDLYTDLLTPSQSEASVDTNLVNREEVDLQSSVIFQTSAVLLYNSSAGRGTATAIDTFVDNVQVGTALTNTGAISITSLQPNTTYKVGLRYRFAKNKSDLFSINITTQGATLVPLSGTWDDEIGEFDSQADTFDIE